MTAVEDFLDTTPALHPAANADQQALLDWKIANPTDRPPAERDGKRRYKLPHPDTGKSASWQRVTNLSGLIDDKEGLTVWRNRLLVAGIAATPGLIDQATAAHTAGDKASLGRIAGTALHNAGEKLSADIGTALHTATEHADLGTDRRPPAPWDADVDAYLTAIAAAGITCPPHWVERIAICAELGVAGTIDRIVTGAWGDKVRIADLKTGRAPDRISYAAQAAIYAHATHLWSLTGDGYEPMPDVDLETALIFHLPAGSATCSVIEVDIAAGWELALLCAKVRDARKRKGMFSAYVPPPSRSDWIVGRIRAIRDCGDPRGRGALAEFWPADVAKSPPWDDATIDRLDAILAGIEVIDAVPLPALDPSKPTPAETNAAERATAAAVADAADAAHPKAWDIGPEGGKADAATREELKVAALNISEAAAAVANEWERQGKAGGRRWNLGATATKRIAAVNGAALACAEHLDDDATRIVIAWIRDTELSAEWPTGLLLGSLTIDQAQALRTYATRIGDGDGDTIANLGRLIAAFGNNQTKPKEAQ